VSVYPFIEAEHAEQDGNVAMACRLLEVSRAAYYTWSKHIPSERQLSDEALAERISEIHARSRGTYGAPRIARMLRREGVCVSKKRVARLMAELGLAGRCKRRYKRTTIPDPAAQAAADLIKRVFGPGTVELDRVYVGDITYLRTWEGWAYLATVIDLASRRVVGWSIADHMETSLVSDALTMAIQARRPEPGFVFHSDRGSQYTSDEFRQLLAAHQGVQSLSRKGQCWDNAVGESWFATLKEELIHRQSWATRAQVRRAVFEFIEVFYNRQRLHSSLDYLSPAEYESKVHHHKAAQAA
jgi:transposase InsO family protein